MLVTAGCSLSEQPRAVESVVNQPDFSTSFIWIPSPELDLLSPSGTVVRGVVEAHDWRRQNWYLSDQMFPGYSDSMHPDYARVEKGNVRQWEAEGRSQFGAGVRRKKVLATDDSANRLTVTVCAIDTDFITRSRAGRYYYGTSEVITFDIPEDRYG